MPSRAQIIATIGPSSKDIEVLRQMLTHQMDVARLNFSWGTHEEHGQYISNIRLAANEAGKKIPIIQDLSGPRIQNKSGHHFNSESDIITDKDLLDLRFGVENNVDYIAMSFVETDTDIVKLKDEIKKYGAQIPVIAKIERKLAIDNLDDILLVADAIIIGRGDMANEVPYEQIPFIQQEIISKSRAAKKPVIVATQMLLSMVSSIEPTRAELTDVSQAITQGADGLMLSEETAIGKYPVQSIEVMERLIIESEKHGQTPDCCHL